MKLGILVNKDTHLQHIDRLAAAALEKDHDVTIFVMDEGTLLLHDELFLALSQRPGVVVCYCSHSAGEQGVSTQQLAENLRSGSQINNAIMMHGADKVIAL